MGEGILRYDYDTLSSDGTDNLTSTIMDLLNDYPNLEDKEINFQLLDSTKGIAMFPSPSIAIMSESESITGHVKQTCIYAFSVVYRTRISLNNAEKVKEWLDNLARWVEKAELPTLLNGKTFKKFRRTTQSYLYSTTDDKAQDWSISIQAVYENEFDK